MGECDCDFVCSSVTVAWAGLCFQNPTLDFLVYTAKHNGCSWPNLSTSFICFVFLSLKIVDYRS